ncbi:hypothetical protein BDZ97DRAFT_1915958 [Flammula alnicola]|nr:hypothetical protein BDZ97DRAFT_1915958 [Flammula alnicola]
MDLPIQGFGDIPTEVLLLIVNDSCLSTQDLYNLATLSRTLNLVALHRYLQPHGIKDATSTFRVVLHGGDMDLDLLKFHRLLAGLAISVHIKSIPTLICIFRIRLSTRVYQDRTSCLSRFQARLDRLTKVILRLTSLPEVHIIDEEDWTENPATPTSDLRLSRKFHERHLAEGLRHLGGPAH